MTRFNPDLLVVLSNQISSYPYLQALHDKYGLSFFSVFSPGIISSIDSEVNSNPFLLSEAMSLLETAEHMSCYYATEPGDSLVSWIRRCIINMRTTWKASSNVDISDSLHKDLMEEYFISSTEDMALFLNQNPLYLGVYLYVYVRTISMA